MFEIENRNPVAWGLNNLVPGAYLEIGPGESPDATVPARAEPVALITAPESRRNDGPDRPVPHLPTHLPGGRSTPEVPNERGAESQEAPEDEPTPAAGGGGDEPPDEPPDNRSSSSKDGPDDPDGPDDEQMQDAIDMVRHHAPIETAEARLKRLAAVQEYVTILAQHIPQPKPRSDQSADEPHDEPSAAEPATAPAETPADDSIDSQPEPNNDSPTADNDASALAASDADPDTNQDTAADEISYDAAPYHPMPIARDTEIISLDDREIVVNRSYYDHDELDPLVDSMRGEDPLGTWTEVYPRQDNNVARQYYVSDPNPDPDQPTYFAKVVHYNDAREEATGQSEIWLSAEIHNILATDEAQQIATDENHGFGSITLVEPLLAITNYATNTETIIYPRQEGYVVRVPDDVEMPVAPPGSELARLESVVAKLTHLLEARGIEPADLNPSQFIIRTDERGTKHLLLIDTAGYTQFDVY